MTTSITVRAAQDEDRAAFLAMWQEFVSLHPDEPGNHTMGDLNWQRIMDPTSPLRGIIALDAAQARVGFTLYITFPFTWSRGDSCYLQDIYVAASSRGQGVARAMIAQLSEIGREAGWFKIFWMTTPDNHVAQRLYEKVAKRMDYLRYDLNLGDP